MGRIRILSSARVASRPSTSAAGCSPERCSSRSIWSTAEVFLAGSTLYLNTNCTQTGVTGPATITGNPIPQTNPTPAQLTQNFAFNPTTDQKVQFVYDLSEAHAAGTLSITPDTIPGTDDLPIDPTSFQTNLVKNTSFATSMCLIHSGELVNGLPACKLFTLQCTIGTGKDESGAQCPVSSVPNEIFQDVFDGPGFTLPDISTPGGPTFHQGVGFLMAAEGWAGGPCTFDPASGLENLPCPQNLLSNFSGPGLYTATGRTSHPNSTFVPVAQVPEDLTTVTVAGQQPGGWINSATANVTLSSQPPALAGTNLPGLAQLRPITDSEHHLRHLSGEQRSSSCGARVDRYGDPKHDSVSGAGESARSASHCFHDGYADARRARGWQLPDSLLRPGLRWNRGTQVRAGCRR